MASGGGGSVVVGYKYFMSVLMGLCRGPVDEVVEIRIGDRLAWTGPATGSSVVNINAPDLFGGQDKEGGVSGTLAVHMGEPTQELNDGYASASLTFTGQPSVGDTVTVGSQTFEFTAYVEPPPDGTGSEGGGDSGDGGEAEGG